jgi:hypothetical protein
MRRLQFSQAGLGNIEASGQTAPSSIKKALKIFENISNG